jgi:cyclophilin family peptidyl-prolyl cis-trans isomerase
MSTVRNSRNPLRTKKKTTPRSSRLEALEARRVLAAPTLADLPDEITIYAGAPVQLALGGQDEDGDALTYTVTSNNSNISASIPKQESENGHRSLRITVQGYGDMVFELFEDRAPETTSRIIEIVESGWYEDRLFHRIIDGFMIQGGSANGDGLSGTGIQFDDEYHADLQFTTSGLLAMAKSGDDTNDSQFFITDVPSGGFSFPRWLDFNYTIFGKLTDGNDVREAISRVATDSNNYPTGGNIVIDSMEIFYDDQNAVMMISAPHGTFDSGKVTVTVSDGNGGTATKTVSVSVLPDSKDNNPFLAKIDPIRLAIDEPYTFQLNAIDVEGDTIYYSAELLTETDDITVEVSDDGVVTITPKNEVVGVAEVVFRVGPTADSLVADSSGKYDESVIDMQIVTVEIPPAQPTTGFAPGSDTGAQDGRTAKDNLDGKELYFRVGNLQATSQLTVYLEGVEVPYEQIARIPQGDGTTKYVATVRVLPGAALEDGDYTLHVQQSLQLGSGFGNQKLVSDVSEPFDFTIDSAPPVITTEAIDYAFQGEEYFYDVDCDDEGNPDVYYEIQMPIPDGMSIDSETGEVFWIPTSDAGYQQEVVILATDGAGNQGQQAFTITIYAPLEITVEGEQTIDELETVSLILTASDPADLATSLTITLRDGVMPADADYSLEQLDGNRARFTWNTTEADGPGIYDLVFGATNGMNAMSRETVRVTVLEVNEAPEFTQVFDEWTGTEDERINLQFVAVDNDLPASELVFDLFGNVPEGVVIDETSGLLSWTPDENDGGRTFEFGVRVTDSGGLSAEHTIVINVTENQKPPIFVPTPAQRVVEGEVLDFTVAAYDPDIPAHTIQYALEGDVPAGLSIDPETGRIRWEVPSTYLPLSALQSTIELTIVAREVAANSAIAQSTRQTVEVTVVDALADLVTDTLAFMEEARFNTMSADSGPLSGPATVSLASPSFGGSAQTPVALRMAEIYDDRGFFGTQFGPTGAAGGSEESGAKSRSDEQDKQETPAEGKQTSSLEGLLDEIAGDLGKSAIEALLANDAPMEDRAEKVADSESESESAEASSFFGLRPTQTATPSEQEASEGDQRAATASEPKPASDELDKAAAQESVKA